MAEVPYEGATSPPHRPCRTLLGPPHGGRHPMGESALPRAAWGAASQRPKLLGESIFARGTEPIRTRPPEGCEGHLWRGAGIALG
eukprot:746667-Alexandrium_andersonii.AAC.1